MIAKLSPSGPVRETVQPGDLGVPAAVLGELRGGDAAENARLLTEILRGERRGAARDIVVVNAAAAVIVAGLTDDWSEARGIVDRIVRRTTHPTLGDGEGSAAGLEHSTGDVPALCRRQPGDDRCDPTR